MNRSLLCLINEPLPIPIHPGSPQIPRTAIYLYPSWGCSSDGRAPPLHGGGQGFDSPQLQIETKVLWELSHATKANRS